MSSFVPFVSSSVEIVPFVSKDANLTLKYFLQMCVGGCLVSVRGVPFLSLT